MVSPVDDRVSMPRLVPRPPAVPSYYCPGHDDRMARMKELVTVGLPLTESGPADLDHANADPECWCCGLRNPARAHLRKFGWEVRPAPSAVGGGIVEMYCPSCYAEWGWPDEL